MLLQLAILFIHDLRRFLLGVTLHLFSCAVRTYVEQLRQIKHPHLSVVCFLKNVLPIAFAVSLRFEPSSFRCERGAFYTPLSASQAICKKYFLRITRPSLLAANPHPT